MDNRYRRPVWAEVDLGAIVHNLQEVRRLVGRQTAVMAVVKANAYGHGVREVARALERAGADWLGVAVPEEAFELRELGLRLPILVLSHTPPQAMAEAIRQDVRITLYSLRQVPDLVAAARAVNKRAKVHIKVDTGMGRLGFAAGAGGVEAILAATGHPEVEAEAIFTHFATADEADKTHTLEQHRRFTEVLSQLETAGRRFAFKHAANSPATIDMPQTYFNMVRPGLILYGVYPSTEVKQERLALRPAMALKARVAFLKEVPPGTGVSYGRTFVTTRASRLAVLPLGYADGYSRLLSNRGEVLVHGRRAPVVGRVCMDQTIIDVTGIDGVHEGDEVVLFGRQDGVALPVEELAAKMGTISYEVLCLVGERVPRCFVNILS